MVEYDAQIQCKQCAEDGYGCSCPSKLGFTSIPTCWYFIIASMTTVGCKHPVLSELAAWWIDLNLGAYALLKHYFAVIIC